MEFGCSICWECWRFVAPSSTTIKVESRFTHFPFPLRVWHCCILRKGLRGEVARVSKEPEAVSYWKEGA